ncbi:hypothetical protein [Hydrogenimonas thermophila]|nr:hypothetical protein [Hydrogenimonas thermophila]
MRLNILLLLILSVPLFSDGTFNLQLLNRHAFVLPEGKIQVKFGYLRINDALDVFNIKEQQIGDLESKYGTMGDMTGAEIEVRHGLTKNDTLFLNLQQWNIAYSSSKLKNRHLELFERHLLYSNKYLTTFNTITADGGVIFDKADDLHITNDNLINNMIQKIKPGTKIKILDGSIIIDDLKLTFYDKDGDKIYPHVVTKNMSHSALFARLATGKRFSSKAILSLYAGIRRSKVTSRVEAAPIGENSFLDSQLKKLEPINFNRYETMVNVGIVYGLVFSRKWFAEFSYEFDKFFRGDDLTYMDTNHIIKASLTRAINRNLSIFAGGQIMFHQLNTDLPYLYNEYTKTQFDKKYGFINLGFVYTF